MGDLFGILVVGFWVLFIMLKITEHGGNAIRKDYESLLDKRKDDDD